MNRKLPPFAAVRAFEAAARHMSFKAAAEELCLSPSAVSHQIRALEDYLDTGLFERLGNRVVLSLTGRRYADKLTGVLDQFDASTRDVRITGALPDLRVLSTPGFAARWLVPRMHRFGHAASLRLRVSVGVPSAEFASNEADVVIHWADAPMPGIHNEPLAASGCHPVVNPALRDRLGLKTPADLHRAPLLHVESLNMWGRWFALADTPAPHTLAGPRFPTCELAIAAAEHGAGVALGYDMMVCETLDSRRLVRLFDDITLPVVTCSFACAEGRQAELLIAAFRDWMLAEIGPRTVPAAAPRGGKGQEPAGPAAR